MNYKTCTYIQDTGYFCESAAVGGREYCCYHLRHLGRQMRRAKQRARGERFDLHLPPLENMHAVQSALSQVIEALAADMIDPKRAHELLLALRQAATNFRHPEAWRASEYKNDQSQAYPASYDGFEAEFGLPEGINLHVPPEVAFPPPASDLVNEKVGWPTPAGFAGVGVFGGSARVPFPPLGDRVPLIPEIPPPYKRDYEAEFDNYEYTPQDMELTEIYNTQGHKAWDSRCKEHQRDSDRKQRRKLFRANYARYAAEAKLKNIERAAEKLIADRLAAEKAAAQKQASQDATTQQAQPEALLVIADVPVVTAATRKPPTPAVPATAPETQKEAKSIA